MQLELTRIGEKLPGIALTVVFALFILLLPRYTDTAKTFYALLMLAGAIYLLFNLGQVRRTSTAERIFLGAVLLNFLWIAFCYYFNGAPERGRSLLWDRQIYFAFLIPLFFLFRQIRIQDRYLLLAIAGSVAVSLLDILNDLAQGIDHRDQGMNPNSFGPIQVCLSWTLLFYFLQEKERWLRACALAGFALGTITVIASGSRNTWLGYFLVTVFFIFYLAPLSTARKLLLTVAIMILSSSLYLVPYVNQRVDHAFASVTGYFAIENHTSRATLGTLGKRVELWKEAYHVFLDKPLTGAGLGGVKPLAEANRERYQTSELVSRNKYVHNQYLAALATRGIPGLILFLAILALPIYIAMTRKSREQDNRLARLSVVCMCLVYASGSVLASHFEGKSAIMFTSIMLPLWLARLGPPGDRGTDRQRVRDRARPAVTG